MDDADKPVAEGAARSAALDARRARLATALRDNLRKRKAQARSRAAADAASTANDDAAKGDEAKTTQRS